MRHYPENDNTLQYFLKELQAETWQIDALKMNPDYVSWGPYEDCLMSKESSWTSPVFYYTWSDFGPWLLDDLNEIVNFYFFVDRSSQDCPVCKGVGFNKETTFLHNTFYDWASNLTPDEVEILCKKGRLNQYFSCSYYFDEKNNIWMTRDTNNEKIQVDPPIMPPPSIIDGNSHDAINRMILVEVRAKRLRVWGHCDQCNGRGVIFTDPCAKLGLVLWVLHPRKGASKAVEIKSILRKELPQVKEYLKMAASRNAERFSRL